MATKGFERQLTQADVDAATSGAVTDSGLPEGVSSSSSEPGIPDLDAIIRQGPMAELLGLNKSKAEVDAETATDEEDAPPEPDEDTEEGGEESEEGEETAEEGEEDSGEDEQTIAEGDIDWEFKLPIKLGDKTEEIALKDLQATYIKSKEVLAKEADLDKAKAGIEEARTTALADLVTLGTQLGDVLLARENSLIQQYTKTKKEQETAKESGDTYQARELKEKLGELQEEYWGIRRSRESHLKQIAEKIQGQDNASRQKLLETFNSEIKTLVPEYTPAMGTSLRKFAIEEGLPLDVVDSIYSAPVVKVIHEYYKLKTSLKAGAVKREKTPPVKKTPIKQGLSSTPAKAQQAKQAALRKTVLSGEGNEEQQMGFMKSLIKQKF